MQQVLKNLNLLTTNLPSQLPATPIPPLQAIVSPSGKITLTGGALDPSTHSVPSSSSPSTSQALVSAIGTHPPVIASQQHLSPRDPNSTGARSFASAAALDPSIATQFSLSQSKPVPFNHRQPHLSRVPTGVARLHSKFTSLHSLSKRGCLVCYRCGDSGHLANSCHNAIVCFACNRLGHRSHTCRAITMLPSSSRPPLTPK